MKHKKILNLITIFLKRHVACNSYNQPKNKVTIKDKYRIFFFFINKTSCSMYKIISDKNIITGK